MIRIDERIPLVLLAEMAAHIGAELRQRDGEVWIAIPEEPNALQALIDGYQIRRRARERFEDDLK